MSVKLGEVVAGVKEIFPFHCFLWIVNVCERGGERGIGLHKPKKAYYLDIKNCLKAY